MKAHRFTLAAAFHCAIKGVIAALHERNFKIELCFMVVCILLGLFFHISPFEWLIVVLCFGLVLGGECFNTALEAVVDLASPDFCELARIAKDAAAGAVLLFSLASFVVGVIIFLPRLAVFFGM